MNENRANILKCIELIINVLGYPPSYREIAEVCDLSISTVHYHIQALIRDGELTMKPRCGRTLQLQVR